MQGEAPKHRDDFAEVVDDVGEILAGLVDGLADRRKQDEPMRRANVLGGFERAIPGLLDEELMLGPRAAVGRLDAPASASSARARSITQAPAVSRRWMADRSRMTFLASPSSDISDAAPVSRALPDADDPRAGQRQDDPVAVSFFGYGRRSGH